MSIQKFYLQSPVIAVLALGLLGAAAGSAGDNPYSQNLDGLVQAASARGKAFPLTAACDIPSPNKSATQISQTQSKLQ